MSLVVNAIYPAFQGEQNFRGIGAPVIFVRLQGCHLRCYKETFGTLCDTPEGLERAEGQGIKMEVQDLVEDIVAVSEQMGRVHLVCLTGGDPLWNKPTELHRLFLALEDARFEVSVETSGTISMQQYRQYKGVHWVLDYKLKSCGVKQKFRFEDLDCLNEKDFIKFVVYDEADYAEMTAAIPTLTTKANLTAGVYWGGKMGTMELFNRLLKDGLLGRVSINAQLHKMAFFTDTQNVSAIEIPQKI